MKSIFKILLLLLVLAINYSYLMAQDAAKLNCLEVHSSGEVSIFWQQPINNAGFEEYIVYFSTNGISYVPIATIPNLTTQQFLHTNADAGNASRYYFIESVYADQTKNSDTLRTIFLQLNNFNFKEAQLYWNDIYTFPNEGTPTTYQVFKEYPLGNWSLIATLIDETEFSETVIVCLDSINYKIEIDENTGCKHVSNLKGAWFKNLDEPDKPVIDSISVNSSENIVIGWEMVPNAAAYIIYRFETGIWNAIDTIYGPNTTFYEDINVDPCSESLTYSVATIDTCGNSGTKDENEQRKSLRINTLNYNACNESIELNWNDYVGPVAEKYEIWMAEDNSGFVKIGETTTGVTVFNYLIGNVGSSYEFYIRAKFATGTSTTCKQSIKTYSYQKPQFVYFTNADVLPSNNVDLTIKVDTAVNTCTWEIYSESYPPTVVSKISSITINDGLIPPLTLTDSMASPELGYYFYNVFVLDSCGNEVLESNTLKTIYLTGRSEGVNKNLLAWNAFEGWEAGVEKYYIFRMLNNVEPTIPVDSVTGQTLEYIDDLAFLSNTTVNPIYWVQAVQAADDPTSPVIKSRSNRMSIVKESEMFVPTAFRPGGFTPEFKPVFRFYNGKNYLFQIYNRWGGLIFESNNPNAGWDGKYNGDFVETGTYVYHLVYQNLDNSSSIQNGAFTVIY